MQSHALGPMLMKTKPGVILDAYPSRNTTVTCYYTPDSLEFKVQLDGKTDKHKCLDSEALFSSQKDSISQACLWVYLPSYTTTLRSARLLFKFTSSVSYCLIHGD